MHLAGCTDLPPDRCDIDDTAAVFPEHLRKKLRANDIEERLNRSIKARTRLISVSPNQASQLRLVSAICMEISDEWETVTIYFNVKGH